MRFRRCASRKASYVRARTACEQTFGKNDSGLICPEGDVRFRICLIDHECGHLFEERSQMLFDLHGQIGGHKRLVHQLHPAVAGSLIDPER